MAYEPLHHKYRPQTFAELVGQEAIAITLTNALRQQKIAPAYLFTGARGTGKTSSARILAKSLNCLKSKAPTEKPCGVCEVCRSIAIGSALDVIEIDAASNTGVDNIRELIERAQFAPVQCRYKVYVIDECLTGDSLVSTDQGFIRIDDPTIVGKKVLSYNKSGLWQFKQVVRWLDQGERQTFIVETTQGTLRCTGNHLIRTETGWIAAKDLKVGTRILSPANVDVVPLLPELVPMGVTADLLEGTSSRETPTPAKPTSTLQWEPLQLENGCPISSNMPSPQWTTNLATVKSVRLGGLEKVYDIEVEDNHNFVANGLLVHNCHMLSSASFNALLKTLEEPPDRVVFVLATTDPQRVLPTIISRCQRFDFRRIELAAMVRHLSQIADKEAINIAPDAIQLVAQIAQGGLRDAESMLDQLSLLEGQITVERVWDLVGAVPERDLLTLVQAIAQNDSTGVIDRVRHLMDRGREPLIVLQNLASFYRDLLIAKTTPDRNDLVAITADTWAEMCRFVQTMEISLLLKGQQHLRTSEVQIKNTTQPRLWLEVTLLGLLPTNQTETTLSIPQPSRPAASPSPLSPSSSPSLPAPPSPKPIPQPQPTPAPSQPEAPEAPPAPEPVPVVMAAAQSSVNLEQVWQSIIEALHPPGTQALFRQQGRLLTLESGSARVGISSQPLFKMAQQRVTNLEAAFAKVSHPVRVSLEVVSVSSAPATMPATPQPSDISPTATEIKSFTKPLGREPLREPSSNGNGGVAETPHTYSTNEPEPPVTPEAASPQPWQEEDEVSRAAKSLAQMFNGQIVKASDELEPLPTAEAITLEAAALEPEVGDPDDDVPF